jgi:hypothetical protein
MVSRALHEHAVASRRHLSRTLDMLLALRIAEIIPIARLVQQVVVKIGLVRRDGVQALQVAHQLGQAVRRNDLNACTSAASGASCAKTKARW